MSSRKPFGTHSAGGGGGSGTINPRKHKTQKPVNRAPLASKAPRKGKAGNKGSIKVARRSQATQRVRAGSKAPVAHRKGKK